MQEALRKEFAKEKIQITLQGAASEIVDDIIKEIKGRCWSSLDTQKRNFERRVKENAALHKMKEDEKSKVAERCRQVRVQQIEPAAKAVRDFNDGLKAYFA